jgi:DNA recombination protein RmuC
MMTIVVSILIGLLIGSVLGWLVGKSGHEAVSGGAEVAAERARADQIDRERSSLKQELESVRSQMGVVEKVRAAAEARLEETQKSVEAQKLLLQSAEKTLTDTFRSLAATALETNNASFLTLAKERFEVLSIEAAGDLESKKQAVQNLVEPIRNALQELTVERGKISARLESVAATSTTLQSETSKLVNALSSSQAKGKYGQISLRRAAEIAGMSPYCDFKEEVTVTTDDGKDLRPDVIIKLPAKREIVVDVKHVNNAFMKAQGANIPQEREEWYAKHSEEVRSRINDLSNKRYSEQFKNAPEFVVMYLPFESLLSAAAEGDPEIIEYALSKNVVLTTPSTYIALLLAIAHGWRQEQLAENAQKIGTLAKELGERLNVWVEHMENVKEGLSKATTAYSLAVGSWNKRVLPSLRKLNELDSSQPDLFELEEVDGPPRSLSASTSD